MRSALCLIGVLAVMAATASTATAATSLIAAYDTYVQGQGFNIKLVDVGTGADIALPAGVNTAQDEFHPALSADGRLLVFTRASVQPLFDGTVLPPGGRTLVMVDRKLDEIKAPVNATTGDGDSAAGIMPTLDNTDRLSYAHKPSSSSDTAPFFQLASHSHGLFFHTPSINDLALGPNDTAGADPNSLMEPTATSFAQRPDGRTHGFSISFFDRTTGTLVRSNTVIAPRQGTGTTTSGGVNFIGTNGQEAGHPALRVPDGFAAIDITSGPDATIMTMLAPVQTSLTAAPAAIDTDAADERAPAWSPDGTKLAFIRTNRATNARTLLTFDSTPGVQALLNQGTNMGAAPSPQLRKFESIFGGVALATEERPDAVVLTCGAACLRNFTVRPTTGARGLSAALTPTAAGGGTSAGASAGIIVAKVTGTTTTLGIAMPKIKPLGRVPLGTITKKGRNAFKWNGKVNGKPLAKGDYLITYRVLTKNSRVRNTSQSIRIRLDKHHRITQARLQQGMPTG